MATLTLTGAVCFTGFSAQGPKRAWDNKLSLTMQIADGAMLKREIMQKKTDLPSQKAAGGWPTEKHSPKSSNTKFEKKSGM